MGDWVEFVFSAIDKRWICLAVAALALAIATVVLARFRLIQSRPLAACVVLSVFAHVLLFLAAYFVDWFETPGFGAGPAISFRLVAGDGPTGELIDDVVPQPEDQVETEPSQVEEPQDEWLTADLEPPQSVAAELPEPPIEEPDPADATPSETPAPVAMRPPIENLVAPELLHEIEAEPQPDAMQPEAFPAEVTVAEEPLAPAAEAWIPLAASDSASELVDRSVSTHGSESSKRIDTVDAAPAAESAASRYGHRFATDRTTLLEFYGGNADTEQAVRDALRWLAERQSPDGRWVAGTYGAGTGGVIDLQDRRGTGLTADTGVTALALLAMLGAGETPTRGEYQQQLQRGFDYLSRSQSPTGDLAASADHYARMYCHGMATLALGEVCSIAPRPSWEATLKRALEYSRASQHRATGGWRYRPGDTGDTSQFGWQVMALVSGQHAGIPLHPSTRHGMEQYLRSVTSGDAGGLASYRHFMPPTPSMTAEALVCRLLLRPELSPAVDEGVRYVLAHPPDEPILNLYYCYYGSLALHLANASWDSWNHRMQTAILSRQIRHGEYAGSWGLDTVWGRCGGRVYTTAMAALTLEVYYRYLPLVDRTLARR